MNVVAPIKPKISLEERARRQQAVDYARVSVRLEGFIPSPFAEELYGRFIKGEIMVEELCTKIRSHYAP